jgi:hypothetical protein
MKIAVTIETKDRRLHGAENYLGRTLQNLARTDFFSHPSLHSLQIVSGGERDDFFDIEVQPIATAIPSDREIEYVICPAEGCTRQQNGARAIRYGAETDADWVLKLEDDLDFIDSFMTSLTAWLEDYGSASVPMFALAASFEMVSQSMYKEPGESVLGPGTSFPRVRSALSHGDAIMAHPANGFWGAQALLWPRNTAGHLANWLGADPFLDDGKEHHRERGHDLLLQVWLRELKARAVGVAIPSFVQHIGRQSNIKNKFFEFPWPGPSWQYHKRRPINA